MKRNNDMKNTLKIVTCMLALGLSGLAYADKVTPPEPPEAPEAPKRAFVGVVTDKVASSTAVQLGLEPGIGLTVKSVVRDSAAEQAGIEKFDILMEMDGQWLTSVSHFTTLLRMKQPGDVVTFKLLRAGKEEMVDLTLGAKESRESGEKWEFKFEEKMEEFGRRMEEIAEREEIMKHMREHVNPDEIEETVRSALEKAQYHINQWVGEDGSHTSIIHSGNARSIITTDEGTLIVEGEQDGSTRVIAIDNEDEVLFNGLVTKDGGELDSTAPWVKEQYEKLANKRVRVIVTDDVDVTTEVEVDVSDGGDAG